MTTYSFPFSVRCVLTEKLLELMLTDKQSELEGHTVLGTISVYFHGPSAHRHYFPL